MARNRYQLWEDRRSGLYFTVKLNATGEFLGMTEGSPYPPPAFLLPHLEYYPYPNPPKLSNPSWRLIRLYLR